MIKAVIAVEYFSSGCGSWTDVADNPDSQPKLPGVTLEEYIVKETKTPTTVKEYKHEARLDVSGKPYIFSWTEYHPQESFDDWCQKGFDHTQCKIDPTTENGWPKWVYSRAVKKFRWVVRIETLEQLEKLLEAGAELTNEVYYNMPDIDYALTIDENLLSS